MHAKIDSYKIFDVRQDEWPETYKIIILEARLSERTEDDVRQNV